MLRKFALGFFLFSAAFYWGQVMESARPIAHAQIGYTGGGTTITGYTDGDAPAAGASGDIWQFDATLNAMDGSDTVGGLVIGITNANHTGSSNTLSAIEVESITGDAQATEYGIFVDTGWDRALALNSANNNHILLQNSGTSFATVGRDGSTGGISFQALAGDVVMQAGVSAGDVRIVTSGSTKQITLEHSGGGVEIASVTQSNLPAADNGSITYCSDCNPDSTCSSGGSGAFAFRIGGSWACELN